MSDQTDFLLAEILKWQRIQGKSTLKKVIPGLLDTREKKLVYELTDGRTPISEISKKTDVATGTVSNWWKIWLANDIIERIDGKRYKKVISLEDFSFPERESKNG